MKKIKAGIIGMGFIGASHVEAIRRLGFAECVAVADVNYDLAARKAREFYIPQCYSTVEELLADPDIDVVHNCTPNNLHYEINRKIIQSGKHIFSEKPLTKTSDEAKALLDLLSQYPNTIHGINFNYRMNPLLQETKNRVAAGELGRPLLVHGSYLQDWLLFETDYNWRVDPEISGISRCVADIGSHWIDCVQYVLGAKIVEVCANLVTAIPVRKKPTSQVETFSENKDLQYEDTPITTEDYAGILFKMDNGVSGNFHVSQVSAGRKCWLNFEIDGSKSSLYWNQETADQMWMGFRDQHNQLVFRNPNFFTPQARDYTFLPAGHPEGWNDALKNNIHSFYRCIAGDPALRQDGNDFATFEDGYYIMKVVDAIIRSGKERRWIDVD